MRYGRVVLTLVLACAAPIVAPAATVTAISGQVLINRGNGYQQLTAPTQAKAGDSLTANPNSGADVLYEDGCKIRVDPGEVVTVLDNSPCKPGVLGDAGAGVGGGGQLTMGAVIAGAGIGAAIFLLNPSSP